MLMRTAVLADTLEFDAYLDTDCQDISGECDLHEHISNLLRKIQNNNGRQEPNLDSFPYNELDREITEQEVRKAVFKKKKKKKTKSPGPDILCTELIKAAYNIISPFIYSVPF